MKEILYLIERICFYYMLGNIILTQPLIFQIQIAMSVTDKLRILECSKNSLCDDSGVSWASLTIVAFYDFLVICCILKYGSHKSEIFNCILKFYAYYCNVKNVYLTIGV